MRSVERGIVVAGRCDARPAHHSLKCPRNHRLSKPARNVFFSSLFVRQALDSNGFGWRCLIIIGLKWPCSKLPKFLHATPGALATHLSIPDDPEVRASRSHQRGG